MVKIHQIIEVYPHFDGFSRIRNKMATYGDITYDNTEQ